MLSMASNAEWSVCTLTTLIGVKVCNGPRVSSSVILYLYSAAVSNWLAYATGCAKPLFCI